MRKIYKSILLSFCVIAFTLNLFAQNDSVFFYREDGTKDYWHKQEDVYAFRMVNGQPYTEDVDPNVVEVVDHKSFTSRKINEMHFKPNATATQRQLEKEKVRNKPDFECEFPVITKKPLLDKTKEKWHSTSDLVMVTFKDPNIGMAEIQQFKVKHDLILDYQPSNKLPLEMRTTYIFRLGPTKCGSQKDVITTAREIFEQDNDKVKIAEPGIHLFKVPALKSNQEEITTSAPAALCSGITLNEPQNSRLWQIHNDGSSTIWNNQVGTEDADADICDCWAAGFSGYGIKIAVIDFYGFEYSHEDMPDRYRKGFNFIDNTPINGDTYYSTTLAHGHLVSSSIVAAENNWVGIAGVARHATVIPYLFDGLTSNNVKALDSAVVAGADVINMSFGSYYASNTLKNKIKQIDTLGRPNQWDSNIKYGTLMVAAAGNDNKSDEPQYPAAFPEVIGVGGTNPEDKRGVTGDSWGTWYTPSGSTDAGSNYGPYYDVVAPGAVYWGADYMDDQGYVNSDNATDVNYANFNGTSLSSPTVAGIAAILLSKNRNLYTSELKDAIINGAEKVNSSIYDYDYDSNDPGRSFEMQYGRVSCINSLNNISVGVEDITDSSLEDFSVAYANGNIIINLDKSSSFNNGWVKLYDIVGKEITQVYVANKDSQVSLNMEGVCHGVYLLNIYSSDGSVNMSKKIVKR